MGADVHTVSDIDPEEPSNMPFLLALDWNQSVPQSFFLNDTAFKNMSSMSVTLDTSHSAIGPCRPLEQSPSAGENLRHFSTAYLSSAVDENAVDKGAAVVVAAVVVVAVVVVVVVVVVHTVCDIDPGDPSNMRLLLAFELTQAAPQSFWLNDAA